MTMMGNSIPVHEYYRIMNEFNATTEMLTKVKEVNERLEKEVEALKAELELERATKPVATKTEKPKKVIHKFTLDEEDEE